MRFEIWDFQSQPACELKSLLGRVAGEIPDSGIDLRECDLHRYSVNAAAGVGKPVFRGRSGGGGTRFETAAGMRVRASRWLAERLGAA